MTKPKKELYRRHRPKTLDELMGQKAVKKQLSVLLKNGADSCPHFILITGASGCGKTTIARIIKQDIGCSDVDFLEVNSADDGGINAVRETVSSIGLTPLDGKVRIVFFDEAHKLSRAAQELLLKPCEDTPSHVWFILSTSENAKIIPTLKSRATEIKLETLSEQSLIEIGTDAVERFKLNVPAPVIEKAATAANGNARKLLVLIHNVSMLNTEQSMLDMIESEDAEKHAIDIARLLLKSAKWNEVSTLLKNTNDEPETIRRVILGYMSAVLLGKGSDRAALIIEAFQHNFFDSGKAGLVMACYALCK